MIMIILKHPVTILALIWIYMVAGFKVNIQKSVLFLDTISK